MRPAPITLNYSYENIRNDIRQKIICEKSQFDSLVWGSLTLTPNSVSPFFKWYPLLPSHYTAYIVEDYCHQFVIIFRFSQCNKPEI